MVLVLGKGSLGHGIASSRDVVRVDIQCNERLDVEFLFPDSIFVRVLMEPHGDKLDNNLFAARNQGNDEKSKDQALEDVEVGIGRGRGVSDKGVFPVVWPSIWVHHMTRQLTHSRGWNDTQIASDHTQKATFLVNAFKISTYCLEEGTTVPNVTRTM
jgi:hypothetical protein